jgi:branched-chain amino acid transport system ATP-binding protein
MAAEGPPPAAAACDPGPPGSTAAPVLRFEQVTKRFGGLAALDGVSFAVPRGAIIGLIGPNGAGKTTVFNVATGAYRPSSGAVYFENCPIAGLPSYRIARLGIARTFQNIRLFRSMTVLEHVLIGRPAGASWGSRLLPRTPRSVAAVHDILALTGLAEVRDRLAATLPYGLQRRVEIARALASEPRLLLLDEPVAGMNRREASALRELILRLREGGLTVLIIEHDMPFVMSLCDYLYVLDFGKLIAAGEPAAVRADPLVLDAYLGQETHD